MIDDHGLQLGALAQPVRVAITGGTVSPPIFETLEVLGRERSLARLTEALTRSIEAGQSPGILRAGFGGSSNGRTTGSGPVNLGSNPSPPTKFPATQSNRSDRCTAS